MLRFFLVHKELQLRSLITLNLHTKITYQWAGILFIFGPVTWGIKPQNLLSTLCSLLRLNQKVGEHNSHTEFCYNEKHRWQHTSFLKACNHKQRNKQLYAKTRILSKLISSYWQLIFTKHASAVLIMSEVSKGHLRQNYFWSAITSNIENTFTRILFLIHSVLRS